jgi:hypothetical protein
MNSRNFPNFLLKPLINFVLLIYLFFSRLFHVDFEAKENGEPIKAVNRCKPLTVDVEGAPNVELLKKSSLMEEYN